MTNEPLTSSNLSKIFIFILLLLPVVLFIVGILPAIFLLFGVFMMKKSQDFSHIETAVRNFKWYAGLAFIGFVSFALYFATTLGVEHPRWGDIEGFLGFLALAAAAFAISILVDKWFLKPLKEHEEWVSKNGIFSSKSRSLGTSQVDAEICIIKGETMKSFSVADELLKWVKLKEDGHITEEEFDEARKKLLERT